MGILLAVISAIIGTGKDIISKKVSVSVHGNVSAFASFAYAVPFYLLFLSIGLFLGSESLDINGPFIWFVLARSISDVFAETCRMHALERGELSTVVALISLHPVVTLITSPLITDDPITVPMIIGVVAAVVGNLIIVTSGRELPSKQVVLLGLLTALFFSINTCFDRLSVTAGTPVLSGLMMNILAGAFLIPTLIKLSPLKQLTRNHRPFLLRGFFEALFMTAKLNALRFITGPELAAIMRLNLVFSVIGGNKAFAEVGLFRKLIGAAITAAGIALMLLS